MEINNGAPEDPHRTREFSTLAVASATTGRMLVHDFGLIPKVLNYVLGEELMSHQLPAASQAAEPHLLAQHPWLADLDPPQDLDALRQWCDALIAEHGESLAIRPASDPAWLQGHALADLIDIAAGKPIVGVVVDGDESRP
jgi:hypothetical protein